VLSWFGDFFRALPDAGRALWEFGDPQGAGQGIWGIIILLIWGLLLIGVPLAIAKRAHGREREWLTVSMACVAGTAALWWIFGVIPSAWVYYVDANSAILADDVIPTSFAPWGIPIATNLYQVIRDSVVVVWHLVAFGAIFWFALAFQKRYPRTLAAGEDKRVSGGYR
jgi:hypothetical protein